MAILRGESSTNKIKTNINKEFNRPPRRIYDSKGKVAKKTLEIFSFIKVCFYYTVFKHSNTKSIGVFIFNIRFSS